MKLSQWCKEQGISYKTGWNWFKAGKLPVNAIQTTTGTILVTEPNHTQTTLKECVIYCRVSFSDEKEDLNKQLERCESFAISNGFIINHSYKEVASGMNDNRAILNKILLSDTQYLIVEHKDILTCIGFNYINTLFNKYNREIIVINEAFKNNKNNQK